MMIYLGGGVFKLKIKVVNNYILKLIKNLLSIRIVENFDKTYMMPIRCELYKKENSDHEVSLSFYQSWGL